MEQKRISIIIPYHNNIEFLKKLLDSIKHFNKIQVIVVDDHSDKNLDEYKKLQKDAQYSEVLFLENKSENRGAGVGRNIGLNNATGEWVLFADSDDYFVDGYYEILEKYIDSDDEVIYFTPTSIDLDTGKVSNRHIFMENEIKDFLENPSKLNEYQIRYYFYTPWSKMIKRSFIEKYNIRFHEVVAKNDSLFSIKVGHYMRNFTLSTDVIYCATWHNKGNVTKRKDKKFVTDSTKSRIKLLKFFEENLSKEDLEIIRYENIAYYFIEELESVNIKKEYIDISKKMFKDAGINIYNKKNFLPRLKHKIKKVIGKANGQY